MLEVALNGLLLDYPYSGTAVYTRNLIRYLPEVAPGLAFRLFVRNAAAYYPGISTDQLSTPFRAVNRGRGVGAQVDKLVWEEVALPAAAAARGDRLLHSLYFAAPAVTTCPLVVTIHDVIPLVLPGYHRSRQSAVYSRLMALAVRRAAAIITVSEHSMRDIERVLGVPADRIHLTYEAVDERFGPMGVAGEREELQSRYPLPERFVLYTGGAERRKGIETLVRAWEKAAPRMRERGIKLVIVADFPPPDRLYPDIPRLASDLGLQSDITFIPAVEEADKPALYRGAMAFAFPSTYEGFGFTPLEALASGVPVLASDATSIPEVVGDAALLLPPTDVGAWTEALEHLADSASERDRLSHRGVERAARFSWRRTAEETAAVYREVLG